MPLTRGENKVKCGNVQKVKMKCSEAESTNFWEGMV